MLHIKENLRGMSARNDPCLNYLVIVVAPTRERERAQSFGTFSSCSWFTNCYGTFVAIYFVRGFTLLCLDSTSFASVLAELLGDCQGSYMPYNQGQ
jgi:hypothetical protein